MLRAQSQKRALPQYPQPQQRKRSCHGEKGTAAVVAVSPKVRERRRRRSSFLRMRRRALPLLPQQRKRSCPGERRALILTIAVSPKVMVKVRWEGGNRRSLSLRLRRRKRT
jgi:hypothetical protein